MSKSNSILIVVTNETCHLQKTLNDIMRNQDSEKVSNDRLE